MREANWKLGAPGLFGARNGHVGLTRSDRNSTASETPMFLVWHRVPMWLETESSSLGLAYIPGAQLRDTEGKKLLGKPVHKKAFRTLLQRPQSRN